MNHDTRPLRAPLVDVFTLGGTIDKIYSPQDATLVVGSPFLLEIVKSLRLQVSIRIREITRKDSLDLDDLDRELLYVALSKSKAAHALVTHGTDTLLKSAGYLANHLDAKSLGKTIVFTGAFVPGSFSGCEAAFNLGFALAVALERGPGIYVAIGGRIYLPNATMKDLEEQKFVDLPASEETTDD